MVTSAFLLVRANNRSYLHNQIFQKSVAFIEKCLICLNGFQSKQTCIMRFYSILLNFTASK